MPRPSVRNPDRRRAYHDSFVRVRDQLRKERANLSDRLIEYRGGRWRRIAMLSDVEIDAHAWWEAERRAIRSINEWNECLDGMKAAMGEAI